MRPATLAEAYLRIRSGISEEKALPEFLDTFYTCANAEERVACLVDAPPPTSPQLDALAGAIAEYLSHEYELARTPAWAFSPERFLAEPWHTTPIDAPGMKEYLTFVSPAEFRARNIFTEERPLRRASMARGKA